MCDVAGPSPAAARARVIREHVLGSVRRDREPHPPAAGGDVRAQPRQPTRWQFLRKWTRSDRATRQSPRSYDLTGSWRARARGATHKRQPGERPPGPSVDEWVHAVARP